MMGLGYLGGGGSSSSSSSSSNLSPLAPPFTVDRSNHRAPNFSDQSYGIPFSSSLQNWPYSQNSTSRPDLLADSARTTAISSVNDYGYLSSDPISPLITAQWPPVSKSGSDSTRWSTAVEPSPKSVTDSFSYLSEAKPYYPPYVSPRINDDIPLVEPSEPSYDLLSSSGFVAANGSSQVDYTQSLSGLEYAPQWDNIWNGLSEGKCGKRMESDDSFFSEDANIAGSIAYTTHINQGASPTDTLNKGKEDSAILPENYADIVRREMQNERTITGNLEGKSVSAKNQRPVAIDFIKLPNSRAFPAFPESYPQASSPELPKETWSNQQPYTLYEKRFQMFDAGVNDCISITKSSPGLVIKPPSVVATIPVCGSISSKNGEISNITSINRYGYDSVSSHSHSKEKEPCEPLASYMKKGCLTTNQLGSQMGRNDHSVAAPYSFKEEISSNLSTQDGLEQTLKSRSGYLVLNVPDGNSSLSVKSAANSSEYLDHHNPAEDSPCWKGAPTPHVFPFEASEDFTSQHPIKKLQTSSGNKLQGNDSPKVPLQQLFEKALQNESLFVDNNFSFSAKRISSANFSEKEEMGDAVNTGCDSAKLCSSKEVQVSSDVVKPKNGYGVLCESNSNPISITSQVKLPSHSDDVLTHKRKLQLQKGVLDHATAAVNLFSSAEDAAKLTADVKMNTHMLVNAMHSFSELLLFHCSNDVCTLEEEDHEVLDQVSGNIDRCMSRKILPVTPTQKLMLAEESTSNVIREGANAAESQIAHKADASSHDQVVLQSAGDESRNPDNTGKKTGQFQGFVSLKDVADLARDHNMVQAIKKVLEENLECEELQTESLLYKNLWLEAEAELCSVSYKARFERMKREIEKSKPLNKVKAADVSENTVTIEKPSRSNISPDPIVMPEPAPEADRGGQVESTNIQDSALLSADSQVDDVEPAIMARFHILKHRGETNPVNLVEREPAVVIDSGVSHTGSQNSAVIVDPHLEHLTGEDNSRVMHYRGNSSRMQNQFGAGWYNGSSYTSSDWEHVLNDEYAWQTDQGHT